MSNLWKKIRSLLQDESGPTSVEYAVIVMLIFLAVIGTVQVIGSSLSGSFQNSSNQINAATGS